MSNSVEPVDELPALERDTDCDLLVVGGGFCGLWGAIQAREQNLDRDVVLIEARSIANGASGRPAAIMTTSVMHGIDNTERMFPDEVAELEALGRDNMDGLQATLERHGIECDLEWGGEMKVSIGDEGLADVDEAYRLYLRYGHEAVRLGKEEVQAEVRSPLFHGAAWATSRCGTVHPGKLVRGLRRAALELGVRVYENTPHVGNRLEDGRIIEHGSHDELVSRGGTYARLFEMQAGRYR